MDYFVVVKGITISDNIKKETAINRAKKEYDLGNTDVSIGKYKRIEGKRCYKLLPLHLWI